MKRIERKRKKSPEKLPVYLFNFSLLFWVFCPALTS